MAFLNLAAAPQCAMSCARPPQACLLTAAGPVHLCLDHLEETLCQGSVTYPVVEVVGVAITPGVRAPQLRLVNGQS